MWIRFVIILLLSWYPFMIFHELGHIISAQINQGSVDQVILVPWKFSQTVISGSKSPLMDIWSGPLCGVLFPLILWRLAIKSKMSFHLGIFAGFCLLANGLYIGLGWVDGVGDTGDILGHGGNVASMVLFGLLSSISGFYIWHKTLEQKKLGQ
jgi:hypothetical protein